MKVPGFPSPRCARLTAAWRPNSIRRVVPELSDSQNSCNRQRHRIEEALGVILVLKSHEACFFQIAGA
jgi:hypothetical protein